MRPSRLALVAVALATLVPAFPARLDAQLNPPLAAPLPFPPNRASINLLGIPFGIVSGEYERFATEEISFGASAAIDEISQSTIEAKARYYPGARGARGFAVGLTAGVARIRPDNEWCVGFCEDENGPLATGFTFGAILDYSWLLGRRERFYVGTGIGAKRVFGIDDERATDGFSLEYADVLPSFRLQTGFVF